MTAKLEKEIASLSFCEKRELVDKLWQQLENTSDAEDFIEPELLKELERRSDEYDANPKGGISLDEFEKKLFRKK